MKNENEDIAVTKSSGNVFQDLGLPDADKLDELARATAEIERLSEDNQQYTTLFDLQQRRMSIAEAEWHKEHPGKDTVLPDLGELLSWLLSRHAAAIALGNLFADLHKQVAAGGLDHPLLRQSIVATITQAGITHEEYMAAVRKQEERLRLLHAPILPIAD